MFKKLVCILAVLCLLTGLAGCGGSEGEQSGQESSGESQSESSTESQPEESEEDPGEEIPADEKYTGVTFADLPESDAPFVSLFPGKGTLLVEYVLPGLDSNEATLVQYSLTEDKALAKVDLGSGVFSVRNHEDGSFSVFDASAGEGKTYSPDGSVVSSVKLDSITGGIGFIIPGEKGDPMLVSEMRTGDLYLVQPDGSSKSKISLDPGFYEAVGFTEGEYIISKEGRTIYAVTTEGEARKVFSAGSNSKAGDGWVAGQHGDYLSFLPLKQGDVIFSKAEEPEESFSAAGNGCFMTLARKESSTDLRLYRMSDLSRLHVSVPKAAEASAVLETGQIVAVSRDGDHLSFELLDPEKDWEKEAVSTESDLSAVLGFTSLPEIGSRDETDAFAKKAQDQYHVRFLYEPCEMLDSLAQMELTGELAKDRSKILHVEQKIVESFSFLPDEVWRGVGGDLPFVVVLCDSLSGNLEGFSFDYGGYSCIFMEIGGNDEYILHLFYHELGHAISRIVQKEDPALAVGWLDLTPPDVLKAVERGTADGTNALTVEFTPDDKNGKVCYVSSYALTNPEEDRAETLTWFRDAVLNDEMKLFSYDVTKKKAQRWGEMIRAAFGLGQEIALPFDKI